MASELTVGQPRTSKERCLFREGGRNSSALRLWCSPMQTLWGQHWSGPGEAPLHDPVPEAAGEEPAARAPQSPVPGGMCMQPYPSPAPGWLCKGHSSAPSERGFQETQAWEARPRRIRTDSTFGLGALFFLRAGYSSIHFSTKNRNTFLPVTYHLRRNQHFPTQRENLKAKFLFCCWHLSRVTEGNFTTLPKVSSIFPKV